VDYLRDEDDDGFSLEEGREGEGHFRKDQGFFPRLMWWISIGTRDWERV
jgi:hypothetical protein